MEYGDSYLKTDCYKTGLHILRRHMAMHHMAEQPLLDTLRSSENEIRLFFQIGPKPELQSRAIAHRRLRGASSFLATADVLQGYHSPEEAHIFEGKNVIFGQRIDEDPAAIADCLRYHHQHHGMNAALILNRYTPDSDMLECKLLENLADLSLVIVIWEAATALGRANAAAESSLIRAPDAPDRRKLTVTPDPWRAKLQQPWLHELARRRFLSKARMVAMLDCCDCISPDEDGFFLSNHNFVDGILPIFGRRIYPWRWRKNKGAGLADHICYRLDREDPLLSWAVKPADMADTQIWQRPRLKQLPQTNSRQFHRLMALRHPTAKASELVPKSSLIVAPDLVARAENIFKHNPLRPPAAKFKPIPPLSERTVIITTMKNEGPFILEWIAHHRAIGVDGFLIYTNDCTDGTSELLDLLDRKGLVHHRKNPWKHGDDVKPQHRALQAAEDEPILRHAAWGICMDVDEFITIKIGDGTLPALYAAMGEANMISLTWRLFGNADISAFRPDFVTQQFTRCAPEIIRKPHQAWGFKTLFRNMDLYRKLGVHRPKGIRPERCQEINWLDGSGQPMPREMYRNGWRSTLDNHGYDWVQLNHYAVRSAESFLVKRDRGRVNHIERDQGLGYWFCMNHNAEEDHAIAASRPKLQAEFARLISDPDIAAAHHACVAAHRHKIATLLAEDGPRTFLAELTSRRMQRLCRLQKHFGAAVFAQGPHSIPTSLDLDGIAPDFFFSLSPKLPVA